MGFPRYKLQRDSERHFNKKFNLTAHQRHLLSGTDKTSDYHQHIIYYILSVVSQPNSSKFKREKGCLLIDPVWEAPAALGVCVSMTCVDEAVFQRPADVVR